VIAACIAGEPSVRYSVSLLKLLHGGQSANVHLQSVHPCKCRLDHSLNISPSSDDKYSSLAPGVESNAAEINPPAAVSATEIVSLRSLSSCATSAAIARRLGGITCSVILWNVRNLDLGMITVPRRDGAKFGRCKSPVCLSLRIYVMRVYVPHLTTKGDASNTTDDSTGRQVQCGVASTPNLSTNEIIVCRSFRTSILLDP